MNQNKTMHYYIAPNDDLYQTSTQPGSRLWARKVNCDYAELARFKRKCGRIGLALLAVTAAVIGLALF
jgi:hypothetical protein